MAALSASRLSSRRALLFCHALSPCRGFPLTAGVKNACCSSAAPTSTSPTACVPPPPPPALPRLPPHRRAGRRRRRKKRDASRRRGFRSDTAGLGRRRRSSARPRRVVLILPGTIVRVGVHPSGNDRSGEEGCPGPRHRGGDGQDARVSDDEMRHHGGDDEMRASRRRSFARARPLHSNAIPHRIPTSPPRPP